MCSCRTQKRPPFPGYSCSSPTSSSKAIKPYSVFDGGHERETKRPPTKQRAPPSFEADQRTDQKRLPATNLCFRTTLRISPALFDYYSKWRQLRARTRQLEEKLSFSKVFVLVSFAQNQQAIMKIREAVRQGLA